MVSVQEPAILGVYTVVAGAPHLGEFGLLASETPAGSNCPQLTYKHTGHVNILPFHSLNHSHSNLNAILPVTILTLQYALFS